MFGRARVISDRILPAGWSDVGRQLLLFVGAYYAYQLVRGVVGADPTAAYGHARTVIELERSIGVFFEPGLQHAIEQQRWLMATASWLYLNLHFTVTSVTLAFVYLFRHQQYPFMRYMFTVAMALALVGYMVFPTAPPRLLQEWGFNDPVATYSAGMSDSKAAGLFFNPFAAIPSMHVAFALMLGVPMTAIAKARWAKVAWASYPLVVTFVVIATGNHFWIDTVLGALVAGGSAVCAKLLLQRSIDGWQSERSAEVAA